MHMDVKILQLAQNKNRNAQKAIYDLMYPKLRFVGKRYLKSEEDIEEALADSFYIIFSKLDQLNDLNAFYAWSRKIMVNQCLAYIRKKVDFDYKDENQLAEITHQVDANSLEVQDLMQLLNELPDGCKAIFNLFVIEGYAHKEIADLLQISVGTSKSQLNFAKGKLQELVNVHYYSKSN